MVKYTQTIHRVLPTNWVSLTILWGWHVKGLKSEIRIDKKHITCILELHSFHYVQNFFSMAGEICNGCASFMYCELFVNFVYTLTKLSLKKLLERYLKGDKVVQQWHINSHIFLGILCRKWKHFLWKMITFCIWVKYYCITLVYDCKYHPKCQKNTTKHYH